MPWFFLAVILTCYFTTRYHECCDTSNDALNFLSVFCAWTAVCWTVIRDVWSHMGKFRLLFSVSMLLMLILNMRSCTWATWFTRFSIWVAHFRQTQDHCLRFVSSVCICLSCLLTLKLHCSHHGVAGWAAAPPTAIAGGTVNDLFLERERAAAMAFYVSMPLLGVDLKLLLIFFLFIYDFDRLRCGSNRRRFYCTTYRPQIHLHHHECFMWRCSSDWYSMLEGNLCSRHSLAPREDVSGFGEGRPDPFAQEQIHLAQTLAQSQPPCDIAFPQLHLFHFESVSRHVSIRNLQFYAAGHSD